MNKDKIIKTVSNGVKESATVILLLIGVFSTATAILWGIVSKDKIYSYVGNQYPEYKEEQKIDYMNSTAMSTRSISTIGLSSFEKELAEKRIKDAEKKAMDEILANEAKLFIKESLTKDNLHNHMKKARVIVSNQPRNYALNADCGSTVIEDLLNNKSIAGEQYVEDLKSKRRSSDSYKEIQEEVFVSMYKESCRIYSGRYDDSQIALISTIATNSFIYEETL